MLQLCLCYVAGVRIALLILALLLSTSIVAFGSPSQRPFVSNSTYSQSLASGPLITSSWLGLQVNSAPNLSASRFLTLTVLDQDSAELNTSSAVLHFPTGLRVRDWDEVTLHCGKNGGVEGCRELDNIDAGADSLKDSECRAVVGTQDGRAFFDPHGAGCEPLAQLFDQVTASSRGDLHDEADERLLSVVADLTMQYQRTAKRWPQMHRQAFWLAHLRRKRASWPLSNHLWKQSTEQHQDVSHGDDREGDGRGSSRERREWANGLEPNQIGSLFHDPYLPRSAKLQRRDAMNGVDVTLARWNLGISLRLPPPPNNTDIGEDDGDEDADLTLLERRRSTLLPVHAPVSGQVVHVSRYLRRNAPLSSHLNDERGWSISIRDVWGFVWHLTGISPYHQHVYEGQYIPQGYVVGHVSTRLLRSKAPLDQDEPVDPPEKPPGGDGNPKYPFWRREFAVGVARPGAEMGEWVGPYDEGTQWVWSDPLHHLSMGQEKVEQEPEEGGEVRASLAPLPPPFASPPTVYFVRPNPYPPAPPPSVVASLPLYEAGSDEDRGDDGRRVTQLDGIVQGVASFTTFAPATHTMGLEAVTLYRLEWALLPRGHEGAVVPEHAWRLAINSGGTDQAAEQPSNNPSSLWSRYMAAMTSSGPFPWSTRKRLGSQWDSKARYALYTFGGAGGWKTWLDAGAGTRAADYKMMLRATDSWGGSSVWRVAGRVRVER